MGGPFQPGYDPRRGVRVTPAADVPAEPQDVAPPPVKVPKTPAEAVASARRILQLRSPSAARRVAALMEVIDTEAPVCPACKRGSRRDEELVLKAAKEVLLLAGITPPKGEAAENQVPAIVFPVGTRIAIAVDSLPSADVRQISRNLPVAVRADLLDASREPRAEQQVEDRA